MAKQTDIPVSQKHPRNSNSRWRTRSSSPPARSTAGDLFRCYSSGTTELTLRLTLALRTKREGYSWTTPSSRVKILSPRAVAKQLSHDGLSSWVGRWVGAEHQGLLIGGRGHRLTMSHHCLSLKVVIRYKKISSSRRGGKLVK